VTSSQNTQLLVIPIATIIVIIITVIKLSIACIISLHHSITLQIGDEDNAVSPQYLGHLDELKPEVKNITTYLERVDLFFTANEVPNGKKVSVLLSCIGLKTYSTLKNLVASNLPGAKTLVELRSILKTPSIRSHR